MHHQLWDRIGISASLICLIHCLVTPLTVMTIPLIGREFDHEIFHWAVAALVVPVAIWALWRGYQSHRHRRVLWLGVSGLMAVAAALISGTVNFSLEVTLMSIGGTLLAAAHWTNMQVCRHQHHDHD